MIPLGTVHLNFEFIFGLRSACNQRDLSDILCLDVRRFRGHSRNHCMAVDVLKEHFVTPKRLWIGQQQQGFPGVLRAYERYRTG